MKLVGFERIGVEDTPDTLWMVSSAQTSSQLQQSHDLVKQFEAFPPVFENGEQAADLITRKSATSSNRKRAAFDDDGSEAGNDSDDGELLFEPGGPTASKPSEEIRKLKRGKLRRRRATGEIPSDETLQERAEARRAKEREKNAKIKSELFVRDSDDESDAERDRIFFEKEEAQRKKGGLAILRELRDASKSKGGRAEKTAMAIASDDGEDEIPAMSSRKRGSSMRESDEDSDDATPMFDIRADSEVEISEAPMSSPRLRASQAKRRKVNSEEEDEGGKVVGKSILDAGDDENIEPVHKRPRPRHGIIIDSSDEE